MVNLRSCTCIWVANNLPPLDDDDNSSYNYLKHLNIVSKLNWINLFVVN